MRTLILVLALLPAPLHAGSRMDYINSLEPADYCEVVADQFYAGALGKLYGAARVLKSSTPAIIEALEHGDPLPRDGLYVMDWDKLDAIERAFVARHVLDGYDRATAGMDEAQALAISQRHYDACMESRKTHKRTMLPAPATWSFTPVAARSYRAKADFARAHPCPSTGRRIPHCPGYVIDHVVPLCAGGADKPSNMQWQSRAASYKKDVIERAQCARRRTDAYPATGDMVRVEALENVAPSKRAAQCAEWLADYKFLGLAVKHGRDCEQMKEWTRDTPGVQDERRAKIAGILDKVCALPRDAIDAWFDDLAATCMGR